MATLTPLEPDFKYYSPFRWKVDGTNYVIEVTVTIMLQFRVCARIDNNMNYIANWCAGTEKIHVKKLIDALSHCLTTLEEDDIPLCSRVKPYFNDVKFSNWIDSLHAEPVNAEFDLDDATSQFKINYFKNIF